MLPFLHHEVDRLWSSSIHTDFSAPVHLDEVVRKDRPALCVEAAPYRICRTLLNDDPSGVETRVLQALLPVRLVPYANEALHRHGTLHWSDGPAVVVHE